MDTSSPDSLADEHEALLAFLYMCPAGLLQLDAAGTVQLANPPAARMLLPLLAVPALENLFDSLNTMPPRSATLLPPSLSLAAQSARTTASTSVLLRKIRWCCPALYCGSARTV